LLPAVFYIEATFYRKTFVSQFPDSGPAFLPLVLFFWYILFARFSCTQSVSRDISRLLTTMNLIGGCRIVKRFILIRYLIKNNKTLIINRDQKHCITINTYIPLTIYLLRDSRGISDIPARCPNDLTMKNTADVTGR
jgi:hypothetical protein